MAALNDSQERVVGKEREETHQAGGRGERQSLHPFQRFHTIPSRLILGFVLVFLLVQPIHAGTFVWSNGTTQILGNGPDSDVILTPTGSGKVQLGALCVQNQTIAPEKGDLVLLGRENLILDSADGEVKLATGKWLNLTEGFVSFADGAVCTSTLCDSGVDTSKLQDGAVTEPKMGSESVSARCLVPGSVGPMQLENGSIVTEKLADGAVIASKISGGAVGTGMLANESVTTPKVADGSITAAKIASSQVQQRVQESCPQQGIEGILEDGSVSCLASANPTVVRSFNVSSGEYVAAGMAVGISVATGTVSPGVGVSRIVSALNFGQDTNGGVKGVVGIGEDIEIIVFCDSSSAYPKTWFLSAVRWPAGTDSITVGSAYTLHEVSSSSDWPITYPGLVELSSTEFVLLYSMVGTSKQLLGHVCEVNRHTLSISCGSEAIAREHTETYQTYLCGAANMYFGPSSAMLSILDEMKILAVYFENDKYYQVVGQASSGSLSFGTPVELPSGYQSSLALSRASTRVLTCGSQQCQVGVVSGTSVSYPFSAMTHWSFDSTIILSEFRFVSMMTQSTYMHNFCVSNVTAGGGIAGTSCSWNPALTNLQYYGPGARLSASRFIVADTQRLIVIDVLPDGMCVFSPLINFAVGSGMKSIALFNNSRIMVTGSDGGKRLFVAGGSIRPASSLLGIAASSGAGGDSVDIVVSGISRYHVGLQVGQQYLALPNGTVVSASSESTLASNADSLTEWGFARLVTNLPAPLQQWIPVPRAGLALSDTELLVTDSL